MGLKIEIKKGNNEQDKSKADVEEANRLLPWEFFIDNENHNEYVGIQYDLENAYKQVAF